MAAATTIPAGRSVANADRILKTSWRMLLLGKADLLVDDPMAINSMLQKLGIAATEVEFALVYSRRWRNQPGWH